MLINSLCHKTGITMEEDYQVGQLIYQGDIYDGLNTDMADLPFYSRWLSKRENGNILELCCGTGRLTLPLAKEGFTITGVDISETMLHQAKQKAAEMDTPVRFIQADIRSFELPDLYDIIFIPFNSIHHLYTNRDFFDALIRVRKHLKKDGLFLFDCFNPGIRYIVQAEGHQQTIADYSTRDGRKVVIKQTMSYESATQVNRIKWHYYINGEFDSVQNMDMRMFYPQELDAYLAFYGFRVLHKFGGFGEEPFEDESDKQIFVCQLINAGQN